MPSGFRAAARGTNAVDRTLQKMGRTFVHSAYGNLRSGNLKSHLARPRHQLRNNGVVAAKLVETSMGFDFYRGFHVHGNHAGSANSGLGAGAPGKSQASRHGLLRNFRPGDFPYSAPYG